MGLIGKKKKWDEGSASAERSGLEAFLHARVRELELESF